MPLYGYTGFFTDGKTFGIVFFSNNRQDASDVEMAYRLTGQNNQPLSCPMCRGPWSCSMNCGRNTFKRSIETHFRRDKANAWLLGRAWRRMIEVPERFNDPLNGLRGKAREPIENIGVSMRRRNA